jgi:hypothetical protein
MPEAEPTVRVVAVAALATSAKFWVVVIPEKTVTDAAPMVKPDADAVTLYVPGASEPSVY